MKIHIWSIIKYIIGFLLLIIFIIIFKQNYLVFLLFPYVILPAGLIPAFLLNVKKVSFNGMALTGSAELGNNIIFYLEYDNPSVLPFLRCSLSFEMKNLFFENDKKNILNFAMLPKKKDRVNISVATGRCGLVVFEGNEVQITGFMGFVSTKIPAGFSVQIPVFPVNKNVITAPQTPYSEGYDEYAESDIKGNLSSDIKEIREYRPGDRISRIHWKISAKLDELAVKEMERTSVMSLVVIPELEKTKISETIDTLNAIAKDLASKDERFEICLYNDTVCDFDYYVIDNEEALLECYRNLYFLPLYENRGAAVEAFLASHQAASLLLTVYGDKIVLMEDGIEINNEIVY